MNNQPIHEAVDLWVAQGKSWDHFTQLPEIVEGKVWPGKGKCPCGGGLLRRHDHLPNSDSHVRAYRSHLLRRSDELRAQYFVEEVPQPAYDAP